MADISTSDVLTPQGAKFLAEMLAMKSEPYVKVGVLQKNFQEPKKTDDPEEKSPATLGEVAVYNEYGAPNAKVPERSFIRATADKSQSIWHEVAEKLQERMIEAGLTTEKALGLMGLKIQHAIQAAIRSNIPPPNKPGTIAAKNAPLTGRARTKADIAGAFGIGTLRDTGQLLNSIAPEVVMDGQVLKD